ncbi:MAG: hypothetical protein OEL89_00010 [Candidatus Peregrinibacteria bacterium]|nr:hypothetical protein [Candidatus Peregrinibacteria bacterium]
MTDYVESDGWLHILSGSDTIRVYCESIKWKLIKKGRIKHYDGGVNVAIPLYKQYVVLTASGIWMNSETKITNFIKYFNTWLNSGSVNVKVQYTTGGSFQKLDGTNTIFPMLVKGDLGEIEKISRGDQTIYFIDKLVMEQTGSAS